MTPVDTNAWMSPAVFFLPLRVVPLRAFFRWRFVMFGGETVAKEIWKAEVDALRANFDTELACSASERAADTDRVSYRTELHSHGRVHAVRAP